MTSALFLCVGEGSGEATLRLVDDVHAAHRSPMLDQVRTVIGEGHDRLDGDAIERIMMSFDLSSNGEVGLASPIDVWQFLRRHEGKPVRLVSGSIARPAALPDISRPMSSSEPRPWQTAAGVAAWRRQQAECYVEPDDEPAHRPRLAICATAVAAIVLVVALHLLAVDAPGLAFAIGHR